MMSRIMYRVFAATAFITALTIGLAGQDKARTKAGEWATYGGDLASTRYSPLDQINKDNFSTLEIAWRFKTDALGSRPEFNFQSTPLAPNVDTGMPLFASSAIMR